MQNIWKISNLALLIACLAMGFYLFKGKSINLNDIRIEVLENEKLRHEYLAI